MRGPGSDLHAVLNDRQAVRSLLQTQLGTDRRIDVIVRARSSWTRQGFAWLVCLDS